MNSYRDRAETTTETIGPEERRSIPIVEGGEPLVRVNDACPMVRVRLRVPERRAFAGGDEVLLARTGVCERLNEFVTLVSPNWVVELFDAYRPLDYQRWRFEQVRTQLSRSHPSLSGEQLDVLTDRYVAMPSEDPLVPPPHSTGGALDLLLVDRAGRAPDYGSVPGLYTPEEGPRHITNTSVVSATQREHRLVLLRAAVEAGFANYPGEWWHYSFGDQEWCYQTGAEQVARYGRVESGSLI